MGPRLAWLLVWGAACSSPGRGAPPPQPGSDLGTLDQGAGDAAAVRDGAPPAPDLSEVYKVSCGSETCDLTADQICCFQAGSTTPMCTTADGCAFFGHSLRCDGPEDCAGTKICCGTVDPYTSGYCVPGPACPGALVRLCRAASQCPAASPKCCAPPSKYAWSCTDNPPVNFTCR